MLYGIFTLLYVLYHVTIVTYTIRLMLEAGVWWGSPRDFPSQCPQSQALILVQRFAGWLSNVISEWELTVVDCS